MGNIITYNPVTISGSAATIDIQPLAQPTNLILDDITPTSCTVSFTSSSGNDTYRYLGLIKTNSSITAEPINGTDYNVGNTLGDSIVAFCDQDSIYTVINLSPITDYFFKIFSVRNIEPYTRYLLENPLTGSMETLVSPLELFNSLSNSTPSFTLPLINTSTFEMELDWQSTQQSNSTQMFYFYNDGTDYIEIAILNTGNLQIDVAWNGTDEYVHIPISNPTAYHHYKFIMSPMSISAYIDDVLTVYSIYYGPVDYTQFNHCSFFEVSGTIQNTNKVKNLKGYWIFGPPYTDTLHTIPAQLNDQVLSIQNPGVAGGYIIIETVSVKRIL